jgi:hypothetical protein
MKFRTWVGIVAMTVFTIEGALWSVNRGSQSCPNGLPIGMLLPFEKNGGHSWVTSLSEELEQISDNANETNSPIVICENRRVLGPAHSHHHDIVKDGLGRFSHWGTDIVFSTSDNSDPNTNGRSYLAIRTDRR